MKIKKKLNKKIALVKKNFLIHFTATEAKLYILILYIPHNVYKCSSLLSFCLFVSCINLYITESEMINGVSLSVSQLTPKPVIV